MDNALTALGLSLALASESQSLDLETRPLVECSLKGVPFWIEVRPKWSPRGASRFLDLVEDGYYDNAPLFRALENFIVQFGLSSDTRLREKWRGHAIADDSQLQPRVPFTRGILSFAGSGADSRETQIFFTLATSQWLGSESPWETPFARILASAETSADARATYGNRMERVLSADSIHYGYGQQPKQELIWQRGDDYLKEEFPEMTYIDYCRRVEAAQLWQSKDNSANGGQLPDSNSEVTALSNDRRQTKRLLDDAADAAFLSRFQQTTVEVLVIFVGIRIVALIVARIRAHLKRD